MTDCSVLLGDLWLYDSKVPRRDWDRYIQIVKNDTRPNPDLDKLIQQIPSGIVYDLGCGVGPDSKFLLSRGWKVIALDVSEAAINSLEPHPRLITETGSLECFNFSAKASLILATHLLGFCTPSKLVDIWIEIYHALEREGILICDFPTSAETTANFYLPRKEVEMLLHKKYTVIQETRSDDRIHDLRLILKKN